MPPSRQQQQQQQPRLGGDLTPMMVFAIFSAVLGMFQFGFNTGVINAPQKVLEEFIANVYKSRTGNWISEELRDLIWSITVSIFAIGGMLGGLMAPTVANWCGRKMGLVLNNSVALIGVLLMSCSQLSFSIETLIIGRFFIGLNCGLNTALVPMYLTEISPVNMRGALGTVSQLGVTIGLLFSQVLGLKEVLGTKELWPILFGFAFVPALLQLIMLPFCPESPRYLLLSCGRLSDARLALRRLRGSSDVESDIEEMRAEDRAHQEEIRKYGKLNSIRELFEHPWLRSPMIIGIMMQLSQQLSGINAIFYYSTDIFLSAELPEAYAVFATLGVGAIMVIMTLISIPMMDRLGRRALHLYGLGGMFLASIFLTISLLLKFLYEWMKYISVISILVFTVFFGIGPGSIPFMITAELFTQGTRPTAMSVSVLFNWLSNFLVGLAFPLMKRMLQSYLFLPFTVFLAIFWIFLYKKLPETKNRTFEEISALFKPIQFNSSGGGNGRAIPFTDYGCVSMAGQQTAGNPPDTPSGSGANQQQPNVVPQGRFRFDSVATESFIGGNQNRQADNCLNLRASNQVCPDHCTFSSSPQQQQKQQEHLETRTRTMARRSSPSRGSAMGRGRSPSPARRAAPPPPPPKAVAPAPAQPTAVGQPAMAAPGGGMMANIASTAAGVAIGHTVGHAITGALGMNGGHSQPEPVAASDTMAQQPMVQQQQQPYGQQNQEPCKFELEQFLSCAQNQSINDLTLCDGFNQVLRECKMRYGGSMYQ